MSKLGDVLPVAIVSTVLVAGLAYATSGTRRWPWPLITLSVFGLAGICDAVMAVIQGVLDDARAEDSGPADYLAHDPRGGGRLAPPARTRGRPAQAGRAQRAGHRAGTAEAGGRTEADEVFAHPSLNAFMAQGHERWVEVRRRVIGLVSGDVPDVAVHPVGGVTLHLPVEVADYVDFYASEHHASNLGRLFRPDAAPLMPNWKHLPVGYHGRAGTVVVSGTDIVRPVRPAQGARRTAPGFGPPGGSTSRRNSASSSASAPPSAARSAAPTSPSTCSARLVNDWSARDIQAWEYVPLGPFLGKSFATSISPWVVPLARAGGRPRRHARAGSRAAAVPAGKRTLGPRHRPRRRSGTDRSSPARRTGRCTGRRRRCSPT